MTFFTFENELKNKGSCQYEFLIIKEQIFLQIYLPKYLHQELWIDDRDKEIPMPAGELAGWDIN